MRLQGMQRGKRRRRTGGGWNGDAGNHPGHPDGEGHHERGEKGKRSARVGW